MKKVIDIRRDEKIRVLHFVHSLVSGGAEKQLSLLCEGIDKNKFQVAIFCVNSANHKFKDPRVKVHVSSTNKPFSLKYVREMYDFVKSFKPDIAHVWLPASVSIPAMIVSRMIGAKIIFSYRNKMAFHRALSYPEFIVALLCAKKIISNHDIVDSHRLFKLLYSKKSGAVINNAVVVPANFVKKDIETKLARRLVFVGRLTSQKNPIRLVRALSGIDRALCWRLDIFGDGEDREEVEALIFEFGLQDKIILHGFSSLIYQELSSASALIFPSTKEGMPNVLVEAMLIGLPIIAGDIAGIRSVTNSSVDDTVVWVDPESELDMTEKLNNLIMNKYDFEPRVRAGRNIAAAYTLERMVRGYELCYENLSGAN